MANRTASMSDDEWDRVLFTLARWAGLQRNGGNREGSGRTCDLFNRLTSQVRVGDYWSAPRPSAIGKVHSLSPD